MNQEQSKNQVHNIGMQQGNFEMNNVAMAGNTGNNINLYPQSPPVAQAPLSVPVPAPDVTISGLGQDGNEMDWQQHSPPSPSHAHKKIKLEPDFHIMPPLKAPASLALQAIDFNLPKPTDKPERQISRMSIGSFDPSSLDDLLSEPLPHDELSLLHDVTGGEASASTQISTAENALVALNSQQMESTNNGTGQYETVLDHNPSLRQKFQYALSCLPMDMQRLFVERLVGMVSNPETMQNHVDAVNALAAASANRAQGKDGEGQSNKDVPLQLAVATLGAFLTQYANAKKNGDSKRPFYNYPQLEG
mmetsp:Transcript_1825/g.2167  ORF Transcript_1825/g.2167 Transcript_1825/m.2167 type:complete len:305 (-) Transcript_1825:168-1082(-)